VDIEPKTSTGANAGWTCSESVTSTGVDEWKRIRVTALIPEGYTARILIGFIDKSCIGTVWFDDLQFEKTENANSFNLLENTNFKYAFVGLGNAMLKQGKYDAALKYFRYAEDQNRYSDTVALIREQKVQTYFPVIMGILISLGVLALLYSLIKRMVKYYKGSQE